MASLESSSCSGSSSDDEVFVSVPRVAHGRHRRGRGHHHERGHHQEHVGECSRPANVPGEVPSNIHLYDRCRRGHSDHRNHERHHQLDQEIGMYNHRDGLEVSKFSRRKNPVLRRLAHRAGRSKKEMLLRDLLRRHGSPDQPGLSPCEDLEVEARDDFPSHLLEDWHNMIGTKGKARRPAFFGYIEQVLHRIRERGWTRPLGAAGLFAERSAARSQLQLSLTRRHGRRRKHQRQHRRPHQHQHHRNCPYQSYDLRTTSYEVCLWQRLTQRPANRFESGPEAQAAAWDSQIRDEVGPLSAYEEMLAQCLLDIPEAGPSATYEEKLAECMSVDHEAGPSATYEQKLAECLMDNPEAEPSDDKLE